MNGDNLDPHHSNNNRYTLIFSWQPVEEGEARESPIEQILALSAADLAELVSLSQEEVLARLNGSSIEENFPTN